MRKIGDLVLIYYMGKPTVYARIEKIEPDVKEGWYQVDLLILSIPAQMVRWILKEEYIDGTTFTMGGVPLRLGEIEISNLEDNLADTQQTQNKKSSKKQYSSKVIDLKNFKKI